MGLEHLKNNWGKFFLVNPNSFYFKDFQNGQFLWKGVFCGKFHSVEKMTFGKNKILSCDLKKQRIPHIKKSTFPFQHPGTGTLASIRFSMLIKDSLLLSSFHLCHIVCDSFLSGVMLSKMSQGKVLHLPKHLWDGDTSSSGTQEYLLALPAELKNCLKYTIISNKVTVISRL